MLQKVFLFSLSAILFAQTATPSKQELNDQLYEAVRKGDVAAVTTTLDRGADVNAKFRYGTTALFKAAERGNADVAKVLLDRGADVKVRDTFYGMTAMTWALQNDHIDVVRLLAQKGADGIDDVLMAGVQQNQEELVKIALDSKALKPDALTTALALSSMNEKTASITEMLKKAGAQPPLQVDAAILQSYAGQYKSDTGPQATVTVKDGKLYVAGFTRDAQPLIALDNTTFRPIAFSGFTFIFNVEAGKVTSLTFKNPQTTMQMKRVD
ncbi:MAG TPA: ankyrin repeat domain-containing protein [Pyrinomonadaceae bacterium]